MVSAGGFHLTKYYMDCVSDAGAACIAYAARLRWGPVRLGYAALLSSDERGRCLERSTFRGVTRPVEADGAITWACAGLGVAGRWEPTAPPEHARLLDAGRSYIDWTALAPRAACELRVDGDGTVTGTGYVEQLELAIPPWRLPFDTLHWGRFLADDAVLVWIAWDGETRLRHVRLNGRALPDAHFAADAVRFGTGEPASDDVVLDFGSRETAGDDVVLRFLETRTVRRAPIVTALESLPALLRRVPSGFHSAEEEKWVSRACLTDGMRTSSGWALHERVRLR